MKQLLFMMALTALGTVGCLMRPFYGVAVYYLFAVLRPQFIWEWSLPPDVQWSRFVALASMASVVVLGPSFHINLLRRDRERLVVPAALRLTDGIGASHLLFAANFFWICVCYVTAHDRDVAFVYFNEYLKIYLMVLVATITVRQIGDAWVLLVIAALSLAYIAYEVNALYFGSGYLGIYRNGYGGLDNNGAGLMLAMGVPLCLAIWDALQSRWRWAIVALVPVILHAVLMTYSRGAMLSLIVSSPWLLGRGRRRVQIGVMAVVVCVLLVPVLAGPEIRERFLSIQQHEVDDSANSRKQSWAAAWKIALDNPVFGVGVRNANLFSQQYGADMEGRTIHNNYLQIAADEGFVGCGLYLAMLGSVWFDLRTIRRRCRGRDDLESRRLHGITYGVEGAMVVFCFGAIFLSLESFELPFLLLLIGAQTSLLVRAAGRRARSFQVAQPLAAAPAPH